MQCILPVILCLWALSPVQIEARQVRINRYAVSVQEDQPAEARDAPYPAAGYRPQGRSFWLPGEVEVEVIEGPGAVEAEVQEGSGLETNQLTTTTELPLEDLSTSTTDPTDDWSTTTNWVSVDTTSAPPAPPAVESRSGRAFVKAPYPPAGYRPSRAFRLPTEKSREEEQKTFSSNSTDSNADHPVCGVSTDPLKPTPEPGSKDEPDSESVVFTANVGPAVVVARAPSSIPVAIPLRSQPLIQAPRSRGFVYTTHVEQRW
ncbi:GM22403 [Drosophila sechellia]|uniref:GM22403 n=2 Tax=Drosophila sechellia TaxID=7238 RepID=B4IAV4_DROSE|nr:GM22403 [Drosophila sechellia]